MPTRRYWFIPFALFLLATFLFVLLAFEAFHGKAVNKAEWFGFASVALGLALEITPVP